MTRRAPERLQAEAKALSETRRDVSAAITDRRDSSAATPGVGISRRSVLRMGPTLAAVACAGPAIASSDAKGTDRTADSFFDPWVEIHAGNMRHNVGEVRRRASSRPVLAVIKNNGYGAGIENVARILEPLPAISGLAVVKLQEAIRLRDAGTVKPVLLMGPFDERDLEEAVARDVTPMVYTPIGDALDRLAGKLQRAIPIHVCVDTGIGRVGVPFREAAPLIHDLAGRPSVSIAGLMMTFTEDIRFDVEQLRRFEVLCQELTAGGVDLGRRHAASTYALFQHPNAFLDMVRPGMAIFGAYPEPEFREAEAIELRPSLSLKGRVIYVKKLSKGDSAGYDRAYVAERDVYVATLPIGHVDGLPRDAVKGARVRIGEDLYPYIGTVSASHSIVEIGPDPRVEIGDVATVFDWREGSRPEDVSAACGASVYDLTMHLNPLLPRRVV